jgi:hypothetical protein
MHVISWEQQLGHPCKSEKPLAFSDTESDAIVHNGPQCAQWPLLGFCFGIAFFTM